MKTYSIVVTFDADELTPAQLDLLGIQVYYQVDDPRDEDGGHTGFTTQNIRVVAVEDP